TDGCERASAISASKAWCRRSSSARCACMDMLGGSPQSDCYLTQEVYTVLARFRSGFRLCSAAIPDLCGGSIGRLEGGRAKRDTFLQGFGVARFGVAISAWPEVSYALLLAGDGGPGPAVHRPREPQKRRKSAIADLGGGQHPQSALLGSQSAFGRRACAARALRAAQASAVAMTKDEERELREQLARLQQEHRDLDAAISALQHSPGSDLLQVQRLKKRKLQLRDRISYIED